MQRIFNVSMFWRSLPAIIVFITLSDETKELIYADMKRMNRKGNLYSLHELLLFNKIFRRVFFVRVLADSSLKYRLIRWTYRPLESLEISSITNQIGGGLQIYHGYSTIIFCHSMGENCTVYQNVTIGRGKMINGVDVPIIGNNVTIYTGAIVIGGIHIGDNVKIGAGAVVAKDVPANTTVVGSSIRMLDRSGV